MTEEPRSVACEDVREGLIELAMGALGGRERSVVLSHVGACSQCAAELAQLVSVSDSILQLAPEVEPPVGFELRLARRLQSDAPVRRPRRWHLPLQWAAAVVLVAAGLGIGWLASAGNSGSTGRVTSAPLISGGRAVGVVSVIRGQPVRLLMTLDSDTASGPVRCQVTLADGRDDTVGHFRLSDGYGAWHVTLPASTGPILGARVVAADGKVLARAHLAS